MLRKSIAAAACSLVLFAVTGRVSAMLNAPGEAMAAVFSTAMHGAPALAE